MGVGGQRHAPADLHPGNIRYPLFCMYVRIYLCTATFLSFVFLISIAINLDYPILYFAPDFA
jgi:hypothetical protein